MGISQGVAVQSVIERLNEEATNNPDRIAVIEGTKKTSYQTLANSVGIVCEALQFKNVTSNSVIAVVVDKKIHSVQLILAALSMGVVIVPINSLLKPHQINYILIESGAELLFCTAHTLKALQEKCIDVSKYQFILFENRNEIFKAHGNQIPSNKEFLTVCTWTDFLKEEVDKRSGISNIKLISDKRPAVILYTSGSTGKPKGVVFTQSNLDYGAASISSYLHITPIDRILALMPFSFDYGLSQLTSAIVSGACLVLFDYYLPNDVINEVIRNKVTGIPAVPHVWSKLAKMDWPNLPHLRYITSTGGRLHESTIDSLKNKLPNIQLYSMYGFTEAFRATYLPPNQLTTRPNSIGKAVPFAQVLVVGSQDEILPPREIGELIQSGPLVTAGYWNDQKATARKFRHRKQSEFPDQTIYAWSGDLVYADEEGYLYYVSRKDDQVKINGYRVSPSEIEHEITRMPVISDAAVICSPNSQNILLVYVFVTLSIDTDPIELLQCCRHELPTYMVPHKLIVLDSLPLNPNRKIDKTVLNTYLSDNNLNIT